MLSGLSRRQTWQLYRECMVHESIVKRAQLFPISRLMVHGVVLATHGDAMYKGLNSLSSSEKDKNDWLQEVWSLAAMGFQLQELYISHQLLEPWSWALLAEALSWAKKHWEILEDAHWAIPANCQGMRASQDKVKCGNHEAASCDACPQGNGASWCNGDCQWVGGQCIRKRSGSKEFRPYAVASWKGNITSVSGQGFVFLRNPLWKDQPTRGFNLASMFEMPQTLSNQTLSLSIVRRIAVQAEQILDCSKIGGAASMTQNAGHCMVAADARLQFHMLPGEVLVLQATLGAEAASVDGISLAL